MKSKKWVASYRESTYNGTDFLIYGRDPDWLLKHPEIKKLGLENVEKLVDGVDDIKNRRTGATALISDIETAEASLVGARAKYNEYADQVNAIVETINALGTTCTQEEITTASNSLAEIKTTTRGTDFDDQFESAEDALEVAQAAYEADAATVLEYKTKAKALDLTACTSSDLVPVIELKEKVEKINRGTDFESDINEANQALETAQGALAEVAALVTNFKTKAQQLGDTSPISDFTDPDALAAQVEALSEGRKEEFEQYMSKKFGEIAQARNKI